jgi:hypothetical protein
MEVSEVTKDYAIVDGEKIYFDEPFDEEPDKADFEKWLHRIEGLLEDLFRSKNADEAVHAS